MAGRGKSGPLSKPDFDILLQALSSTTKGRQFLDEYRRRCQPAETQGLLNSLSQIELAFGTMCDQLRPEKIAAELRSIAMTLEIAVEGAPIDADGDETERRFALCERARWELATLANSLDGAPIAGSIETAEE